MHKQQLHQAHIDWLASSNFDVFATLKFKNGYDISEPAAQRVLSIYLNTLDRTYYGKRDIRLGNRITRFVYLHKGQSGKNTHFHIAFRTPRHPKRFCEIAHMLWASNFTETCGDTSQVTQVRSRTAASIYALHEYSKLGEQTFIGKLSHTNGT